MYSSKKVLAARNSWTLFGYAYLLVVICNIQCCRGFSDFTYTNAYAMDFTTQTRS